MRSIIVFVIASHSNIYDSFLGLWREKIRLGNLHFPDVFSHLRFFFVFSEPCLTEDIVCEEDVITCKCTEGEFGEPGIFFKTMAAFKYCETHFTYDAILRTNLSSFWNFPVFYSSLENESIGTIFMQYLDRNHLEVSIRWKSYFEVIDAHLPEVIDAHLPEVIGSRMDTFYFLDGAGFLLSREMIQTLLYPVPDSIILRLSTIPDDVAITVLLVYICCTFFPKNTFILNELLPTQKWICKDIEFPEDYRGMPIGFIRNKIMEWGVVDRKRDVLNFKQQLRYYYSGNI